MGICTCMGLLLNSQQISTIDVIFIKNKTESKMLVRLVSFRSKFYQNCGDWYNGPIVYVWVYFQILTGTSLPKPNPSTPHRLSTPLLRGVIFMCNIQFTYHVKSTSQCDLMQRLM